MTNHRAPVRRRLTRRQTISAAVIGALILIGAAAPARVAGHATILPPCPTEDAVPVSGSCVWHAKAMGNERGQSFTVSPTGAVTYLIGE